MSIGVAVPSPPQGETEAFHLGEKGMATGRLQEYKCVQVNCQGSLSGGNLVMDWHPIKGGGGERGRGAVAILPVAPC